MKFFKRKNNVVDLGVRYEKQQEKLARLKENLGADSGSAVGTAQETSSNTGGGIMSFFGNMSSAATTTPDVPSTEGVESAHERKRRLAKRLRDMTDKIEELNNQIYHLQQRIEVLERKNNSY